VQHAAANAASTRIPPPEKTNDDFGIADCSTKGLCWEPMRSPKVFQQTKKTPYFDGVWILGEGVEWFRLLRTVFKQRFSTFSKTREGVFESFYLFFTVFSMFLSHFVVFSILSTFFGVEIWKRKP